MLAETVVAPGGVFELNGKGVLVQANAQHDLVGGRDDLHEQEVFRKRRRRIEHYLANVRRAAAFSNLGKVRAEADAFSSKDVTGGTRGFGVDRCSARGIAAQRFGGDGAERANVSGDVGDFLVVEKPGVWHCRLETF